MLDLLQIIGMFKWEGIHHPSPFLAAGAVGLQCQESLDSQVIASGGPLQSSLELGGKSPHEPLILAQGEGTGALWCGPVT